MDVVRKLILEKLAEKRLTMKGASIKIGYNHAYLQQFLKRGVPAELDENARAVLADLLGVSEDQLRGTSSKLPKRDYVKVNANPREDSFVDAPPAPKLQFPAGATPWDQLVGERDLQVFGTEQMGSGILIVTNEPVGLIVRPEPLFRIRDGYGMIVTGDSVAPEHKSGSIALVNPHHPPETGKTCVFRHRLDDGTEQIILAELRRFNDQTWYVQQWKPKKKNFTLKRSDWKCHVTVGNFFRG
jgi:phage repressor protein C with HTH and peptisase S24 domain